MGTDERKGDMAADCGCIFNYPSCKTKTSDLNCCSDYLDCYTDYWKWQIMITRKKFGSFLANAITELELFLNDFTTTLSTPIYIAHLHILVLVACRFAKRWCCYI
jgi:hypothetical protein